MNKQQVRQIVGQHYPQLALTQSEQIREFLMQGNAITTFEAFKLFGFTRLSAIIYKLKNEYHMPIVRDRIQIGKGRQMKYFYRYYLPVSYLNTLKPKI